MTIEKELKPCPFCNGDPHYYEETYINDLSFKDYAIECIDCCATIKTSNKELTIKNWNMRSNK